MADERIAALEAAFIAFRENIDGKSDGRDKQIGLLATEGAAIRAGLQSVSERVGRIEVDNKPPGFVAVWGPLAATVGIVITVVGALTLMIQRETEAKLDVLQSQVHGNNDKLTLLREDSRFLDSQIRITERDFRGALADVKARQEMIEKRVDDIDLHGSRIWVRK